MVLKEVGEDRWVWKADQLGGYSVKSAYKAIINGEIGRDLSFYNQFWHKYAPLKVAGFTWRLALDRVPSKVNLANRGMVHLANELCMGFHAAEESASHLFFECTFFSEVWRQMLHWLGFMTALHRECRVHFNQFNDLPY